LSGVTIGGLSNKLNLCCASHPSLSEQGHIHRIARFSEASTCTGSKRGQAMNSPVIKRSVVIAGHKTSVSLEDAFWGALKEIATGLNKTLSDLVAEIDTGRPHGNLSSAIRLFVLDHYRAKTNGHTVENSDRKPLMVMSAAATSVPRPQ
jgi:predicted DNA-binding ribbon-helix-helix protein